MIQRIYLTLNIKLSIVNLCMFFLLEDFNYYIHHSDLQVCLH